ncbi:MAG TPA: aldehyde-activating protein [Caulobacteraceae bacterium]
MNDGQFHSGHCHCGRVSATFRTTEATVKARSCQCDFCRRHGAKTVTDTDGFAEIVADGPLMRYHFGLMTAEYLMCPKCGTYVACVLEADGIERLSLNAAGLQMAPWADLLAEPVDYSTETLHERLERRRARWTPGRVRERVEA